MWRVRPSWDYVGSHQAEVDQYGFTHLFDVVTYCYSLLNTAHFEQKERLKSLPEMGTTHIEIWSIFLLILCQFQYFDTTFIL